MGQPSIAVIKRLYAVSGNRCAFPKCSVPLVDVGGKVTGRTCHIKARSEGGPRYDPGQTDEQRNSYENLLLLCPIHHDVIDADESAYTVERLIEMKATHEASATPVQALSDESAAEFIRISLTNTVTGSQVSSIGQTGGQVANVIANYLGSEPIGRAGWSAKLREKEADVLTQAWDSFHEAFGAVWDATSAVQFVTNVENMTPRQFEEFLAKLDVPDYQKDELRESSDRRETYKKIDFMRRYSRAQSKRIEFHNFVVKHRIILFNELRDLLTEVDSVMIDAMIKLEIGSEDDDRAWRVEAFRLVQRVEAMVPRIEKLIHDRLHG